MAAPAHTLSPPAPAIRVQPTHAIALAATVATYLLIVMGSVVRVTGSGLGCPDWPTCHGQLIPPPDPAAWIEWTHRTIGAATSLLILAACGSVLVWRRREPTLLAASLLVPVLLVGQVLLGAIVVWMELPNLVVLVHLMIAFIILGLLVWLTVATHPTAGARARVGGGRVPRLRRLVATSGVVIFGLLLAGAYTRAMSAGWACVGFPTCNGQGLFPFGQSPLTDIQLVHRLVAYTATALVLWLVAETWRVRRQSPSLWVAALSLLWAILVQAGIGAIAVSTGVPPVTQSLHVAGAAATWVAMISLYSLSRRALAERPGTLG